MRFSRQIIDEYPYPLAIGAKRFNDATEHVERFLCLAALIESTIKYLAAIATVEYLQDDEIVEKLQKNLQKLRRPTLGHWNELLRANVAHFAAHRDKAFTVPELRDGYAAKLKSGDAGVSSMLDGFRFVAEDFLKNEAKSRQSRISIQTFLDLMVNYRNESWGHNQTRLGVDDCEKHTKIMQPAVTGLLEQLSYLTSYPLLYVKKVEIRKGENVHFIWRYVGTDPRQVTSLGGDYRREQRLFLCDKASTPTLSLHPFFIVRNDSMYILQYNEDNDKIIFSHCATGEDFKPGPNDIRSYQISRLADDRFKKLTGIELPIPLEDPPDIPPTPQPPMWAELLERLDDESRRAIVLGLGEAARIGHFWLGVEFLLMGLSRSTDDVLKEFLPLIGVNESDLRGLIRGSVGVKNRAWREQRDIEALGAQLLSELHVASDNLAGVVARQEAPRYVVTPRLMKVMKEASLLADNGRVKPGHLLRALLGYPESLAANFLLAQAHQAGRAPQEIIAWLDERLGLVTSGDKQEEEPASGSYGDGGANQEPALPILAKGGILAQNGRDLTALAYADKLRPAIGTNAQKTITQIGLILQQTKANNPVLLGDPGVGKSAVAEGFAWRLAVGARHGQPVEHSMGSWRVIELSVASLMAGTGYRGDLEKKLQMLLKEVREANGRIIVFIDEIHAVLAGRSEGGLGTIADALKPALARGEFPCIGATTVVEYRRYIERDPALARRFSPVWIEEPSEAEAIEIAGTVARTHLAESHHVAYSDEAVEAAVRLSRRYLHDEFLPGKAIKVLDQAGPQVRLGGTLRGVAGEVGAVKQEVTADIIQRIIAERTGIPLLRLTEDGAQRLLALENRLRAQVIGQDEALRQVSRVVKRARTGMADPNKPLGVFLFAGPTGVGKTELALALAGALFDEGDAILRLDMSEFMEKHHLSRLTGAPPGYIGYEQEGQLTGFLRRRPYSLVLLDEMEKAHPQVQNLFLQLFDAGRITDSTGRVADGRNALFIMTTNLGAKEALGLAEMRQPYQAKLQSAIDNHFSAEFIGRIDRIVYFEPLSGEVLIKVFDKLFAQIAHRFSEQGVAVTVSDEVKELICRQYTDVKRGARDLQRAIDDAIVGPIIDRRLAGKIIPGMQVTLVEKDGAIQIAYREPQMWPPLASSSVDVDRPRQDELNNDSPEMDSTEKRNRDVLAPLVLDLKQKLAGQGFGLEISESVMELLCSPYMAEEWVKANVAAAFESLVVKPLEEQIKQDAYEGGDVIEVVRDLGKIAFHKKGGGAR